MVAESEQGLIKISSGIPGLDFISEGGFPSGRTTLLSGTCGSGKTVFACHFLAGGITAIDQNGVFVTFEESPSDIRRNAASFGWDIGKWESEGKWIFVDATSSASEGFGVAGEFDIGALLARIEFAVRSCAAKRVSIDSLGFLLNQFSDDSTIRQELLKFISAFKKMGVSTVIVGERLDDYGIVSRYGIEEFVADNVILLRNFLDNRRRLLTIEILKLRGASHRKGEYGFSVVPGQGITVLSDENLFEKSEKEEFFSE
jgi:circadian clock protein KaiC